MGTIPKKVAERFIKTIPKFQKVLKIAKDRDVNESDTVSILKDVLSEVFGYDKYVELTGEFAIRGTYCDLAVRIDDKVQFLVEVKAIGIDLKENHMRQALDYGANHGIQWIVLSNGIEWQLYRIRFEKPINYDLVYAFDFTAINPRAEKDRESLFLISKEGLAKNVREEFYEKVQNPFTPPSKLPANPHYNRDGPQHTAHSPAAPHDPAGHHPVPVSRVEDRRLPGRNAHHGLL